MVGEEGEGVEGVGPGEGQLRLQAVGGGEEMSCLHDGSLLNPYLIMIAAEYKEKFSSSGTMYKFCFFF